MPHEEADTSGMAVMAATRLIRRQVTILSAGTLRILICFASRLTVTTTLFRQADSAMAIVSLYWADAFQGCLLRETPRRPFVAR